MGSDDAAASGEHTAADLADSVNQPLGEDGPEDRGDTETVPVDAASETLDQDAVENGDTGIGPADAVDLADAPSENLGLDARTSGDTGLFPVDGIDSGGIDGGIDNGNSLAGLRIAFVGTENPTSELSLITLLGQSTGVVPGRILRSEEALTGELLVNYDVLILERLVRAYSQDEAAVLTAWVSRGGAVLSISGFYSSGSDTTNTNSLLSGIGLAYGGFVLGGSGGPFYITDLASHPIMAGITSLPFWGGFTVWPAAGADGLGTNTTLATSTGQPLCLVQVRGQGRVLVWGDEWVENDEMSGLADVRRFWLNALAWLGRR